MLLAVFPLFSDESPGTVLGVTWEGQENLLGFPSEPALDVVSLVLSARGFVVWTSPCVPRSGAMPRFCVPPAGLGTESRSLRLPFPPRCIPAAWPVLRLNRAQGSCWPRLSAEAGRQTRRGVSLSRPLSLLGSCRAAPGTLPTSPLSCRFLGCGSKHKSLMDSRGWTDGQDRDRTLLLRDVSG